MARKYSLRKKMSTLRKALYSVLFALGFATISSCAGGGYQPLSSSLRTTTSDTTSYVQVGEIWNSTSKTFNKDNVNILMKYISGNSSATISDLDTLAQTASSYGTIYNGYSSANMRSNTLSAGTEGSISYSAKSSSRDIQVKLGDLNWECVYLSKDTNGNTILTLWLDNCVQDAWSSRSSTEGEYYGYDDGILSSTFAYGGFVDNSTYWYKTCIYGTSYIRSVTLNNGGSYAVSTDAVSDSIVQNSSSAFALFTMSEYGLVDYLTTPRYVSWQETQYSSLLLGDSYVSQPYNAEWRTGGYFVNNFTTSNIAGYDFWADDYLWLPSEGELCCHFWRGGNDPSTGVEHYKIGLWKVSEKQRACEKVCYGRTGPSSGLGVDLFGPGGSDMSFSSSPKEYRYAVRPALHLNLTAVVNGVDNSTYVQVGELYDEETKSINYTNLDILAKYLTGNANATMDTTVWGSNSGFESFDCRDIRDITLDAGTYNGVAYSAKKGGQDVVVRLGGLDWYVVWNYSNATCQYFTFYLKGGGQEKWLDTSKYTSTAGDYYGFIDGMLYGNYSANYQSTNVSGNYPSNMYGTSYLNSVILNNGGTYATSTTTSLTASQSSSNPFALYTMASGGLTKYLVKSSDSYHYNMGKSFVLKGSPSDSYDYSSTYVSKTHFHSNDSLRLEPNTYGTRLNSLINEKYRYYDKTGYANWGDGYLWIPSILETGYGNVASCWYLSESQQANGSLTDSFNIIGTVGTKGENAYASSWLRSAHNSRAYMAYTLLADGSGCGTSGVGSAHVIRPALHFNITAAEADRPSTASVSVESLGQKIFESNSYVSFNDVAMTYKKTA